MKQADIEALEALVEMMNLDKDKPTRAYGMLLDESGSMTRNAPMGFHKLFETMNPPEVYAATAPEPPKARRHPNPLLARI